MFTMALVVYFSFLLLHAAQFLLKLFINFQMIKISLYIFMESYLKDCLLYTSGLQREGWTTEASGEQDASDGSSCKSNGTWVGGFVLLILTNSFI